MRFRRGQAARRAKAKGNPLDMGGDNARTETPPLQSCIERRRLPLRTSVSLLYRTFAMAWRVAPMTAAASAALAVVSALLPVTLLYVIKLILDRVTVAVTAHSSESPSDILLLLMLLAGVLLMRSLCDELTRFVREAQNLSIGDYVLDMVHQKSITLDLAFYENPRYLDTLHRAQQEAGSRPAGVFSKIIGSGQAVIGLVATMGLLASFHWGVPLILFLATIPLVLVSLVQTGRLFHWQRKQTSTERQAAYYHSLLTGDVIAKELRLLGVGSEFACRFRKVRQRLRVERLGLSLRRAKLNLGAGALASGATLAAWGWMIARAWRGEISIGALVMYQQAFQQGQSVIAQTLLTFADLYQDVLYLSNLYEFLDLPPRILSPPKPVAVPAALSEGIVFNGVSFRYPDSQKWAVQRVSFRVPTGQMVVLVGENGSGKTTLLKLLARLYDPAEGSICLDGTDLKSFCPEKLRRRFSFLCQDFGRFQLSAWENILLGDIAAEEHEERLLHSAHDAMIHDTITALPNGYETLLGRWFEEGQELSVGQWQKVALARAFFRDAPVVVLDEPTSALDAKSELQLAERLKDLLRGKTSLVVSHRLAFARAADWIVVMNHGEVVEEGVHENLMAQDGAYASLFQAQACHYI